jgi:hypothetical protein
LFVFFSVFSTESSSFFMLSMADATSASTSTRSSSVICTDTLLPSFQFQPAPLQIIGGIIKQVQQFEHRRALKSPALAGREAAPQAPLPDGKSFPEIFG